MAQIWDTWKLRHTIILCPTKRDRMKGRRKEGRRREKEGNEGGGVGGRRRGRKTRTPSFLFLFLFLRYLIFLDFFFHFISIGEGPFRLVSTYVLHCHGVHSSSMEGILAHFLRNESRSSRSWLRVRRTFPQSFSSDSLLMVCHRHRFSAHYHPQGHRSGEDSESF